MMRWTPALAALALSGCAGPITAGDFATQLHALQCTLDTCHRADDGCTGFLPQPRSDCDFDPDLGEACLDAVQALVDTTPEMWREDEDGELAWCVCGEVGGAWTVDWESPQCQAMPEADDLPSECDVVCTDL